MLKKSLITVLFSLVFALILGTSGAFAAEETMSAEVEKALEEVEKTNVTIYEEIEKAKQKSWDLFNTKNEDLAKETSIFKIAEIELKYEEEVVKLISDLDQKTQQLTHDGIEKAQKAGLIVKAEWILVDFADRQAWIDPIKVMNW